MFPDKIQNKHYLHWIYNKKNYQNVWKVTSFKIGPLKNCTSAINTNNKIMGPKTKKKKKIRSFKKKLIQMYCN